MTQCPCLNRQLPDRSRCRIDAGERCPPDDTENERQKYPEPNHKQRLKKREEDYEPARHATGPR
ncbi:unannotated protein [freshwater metagenome]|uniref:Unannotated protein n=1 Tax=freshwater metagenome TaxID=449393 RepID=A0A6J6BLM6_9ZZZZ